MLTLWEILEQLCNGGFLVESFQPDAASRVGLYRWCDGYCAELTSVGHALLSRMIEIGLIELFKTGIDYEGRQADFYFLLGQSPLSK